MRYR
jgi:hypothetical protein